MVKNSLVPATLSALLQDYCVEEGIRLVEQRVKIDPAQAAHRYSLFQLLCVVGDWRRALQQIQLCARIDANYTQRAQVFGELIRCEMYRQACFKGEHTPAAILPFPGWVAGLQAALAGYAKGETARAQALHAAALNAAEEISGRWDDGSFDWISDSDSRLGPVVELVTGGVYTWLPFTQIRSLSSSIPARLTDLLWKPVTIALHNGDTHRGWLFTRYSGSENGADPLRTGRETAWLEGPGEICVQAQGQKVWLSSHGDINLLALTDCHFNPAPGSLR